MKWLVFAVAIAGCINQSEPPQTLPRDAHYSVLFDPWPTMEQCLENLPPEACAVPEALSLCKNGRAVFYKHDVAEVGTYAMDAAHTGETWVATVTTQRFLLFFDVELQELAGTSSSSHWTLVPDASTWSSGHWSLAPDATRLDCDQGM